MLGSLISAPGANALLSEKRVWENFSTTSLTAPVESLTTQTSTKENLSSAYDFALGCPKYLYTHANPVNGTDPSGNSLLAELTASTTARIFLANATISFGTTRLTGGSIAESIVSGLIGGIFGSVAGKVGTLVIPRVTAAVAATFGSAAAQVGNLFIVAVARGLIAGSIALVANLAEQLVQFIFFDRTTIDLDQAAAVAAVAFLVGTTGGFIDEAFSDAAELGATQTAQVADDGLAVFAAFLGVNAAELIELGERLFE